jgi:L-threonylcarbamoyladenylate synthase
MARFLSQHDISLASDALKQGNLVAIPTETVYGLAGNALNPIAVAKIFAAKERPSFDPLIVHVPKSLHNINKLKEAGVVSSDCIAPCVETLANRLMECFWPGPLTIILPRGEKIPHIVTSGLETVGVRMPAHPLAQELLQKCNLPLAAPSANRFGRISPTLATHVQEELGDKIDFILDGGPCEIGLESTVISISEEPKTSKPVIWLIRPGQVTKEQLMELTKAPVQNATSEHEKASPGMLLSHYAPVKPMLTFDEFTQRNKESRSTDASEKNVALLVVSGNGFDELNFLTHKKITVVASELLSPSANDQEAAKNLFSAMRSLDSSAAEIIIVTSPKSKVGLWVAISDRLKRACKAEII